MKLYLNQLIDQDLFLLSTVITDETGHKISLDKFWEKNMTYRMQWKIFKHDGREDMTTSL